MRSPPDKTITGSKYFFFARKAVRFEPGFSGRFGGAANDGTLYTSRTVTSLPVRDESATGLARGTVAPLILRLPMAWLMKPN